MINTKHRSGGAFLMPGTGEMHMCELLESKLEKEYNLTIAEAHGKRKI